MQRGLGLVELMLAVLLSVFLVLAVVQVFLASSQTNRLQDDLSRLQENGRYAIDSLQQELRMAGYNGCSRMLTRWENGSGASGQPAPGPDPGPDPGLALTGWEAVGTGPGDSYSLAASGAGGSWGNATGDPLPASLATPQDIVPGTDVLLINRAVHADVILQGNPGTLTHVIHTQDSTGIPRGVVIVAANGFCTGADMFRNNNEATARGFAKHANAAAPGMPPGAAFSQPHDDLGTVYIRQPIVFFIRRNAATGRTSLYRSQLNPGAMNLTDELVEGVESMQILYGFDANGNDQVDGYVTAAEVSDWSRVFSVRLALLLRSAEPSSPEGAVPPYRLAGTLLIPGDDRHSRQVVSVTIRLRNQLP